MAAIEERLEGHDQIRAYLDPHMSRSYYFDKVRPRIEPILFKRPPGKKKNLPRVFTYKDLIQIFMIRVKNL